MAWPLMLWVSLVWSLNFYLNPAHHTVKRHIESVHEGIKPVRMAKWNYNRGTENEFGRKYPNKEKITLWNEMIFTITDAEILEPIQNKSENDKTLEDLMFSDHELVQKSSENKRTAVSLNNRGLSIV